MGTNDKTEFKSLRKLSFKDSTIEEILSENGRSELKRSDEEALKRMGRGYFDVHNLAELRVMAKNMGVKSPCTHSKTVLIDKIMDIIWGLQYFDDDKLPLLDADVKKLSPDDEMKLLEDNNRGDYVLGRFVEGVFEGDETGGVLRLNRFVKNIEDVGVIRRFVNIYGIKSGDIVSGRARYVESAGFFCMHYVDAINGVRIDSALFEKLSEKRSDTAVLQPYQRLMLSAGSSYPLLKLIDVFTPVVLGQCVIVSSSGKFNFAEGTAAVAASLERSVKVDETVVLCLGESSDNYERLSEVMAGAVFTRSGNSAEDAAIVARARDYAAAQARCGKNIVVLLNNIECAGGDYDSAARLADAARQYEHGGSVTVIAFADRDLATGQYYRIKNYVSAELFLTSRAFYNDFRIELSCCYSRSGATFTRREKAAFGKLKEIAVEEGEAAAVGAALVGSTYDDVIESLSSGEEKEVPDEEAAEIPAADVKAAGVDPEKENATVKKKRGRKRKRAK